MVSLKGDWTPFRDLNDQLNHYRQWGLIPEKSKKLRPIMVVDGYFGTPIPCQVVGYQTDSWAVIQLEDGYHAIHGDYLAELQPVAHQRLPHGICFAEILSNYVVVDIESTGFDRHNDRIIEIGAVRYQYGKKVAEFDTLVNPEMLIPLEIVSLTGITQDDVNCAPCLDDIKKEFLDFIGDLPIIGHNAPSFDIPFLSAQMGVEITNTVLDTIPMARDAFPLLPNHKLDFLKTTLQLFPGVSHRALSDVEATNALMWAAMSPRKYETLVHRAYLDHLGLHSAPTTKKEKRPPSNITNAKRSYKKVDIKSIVRDDSCSLNPGPLCGKNIVFTGELSMEREAAMQLAVNAGATLKSAVSRKTDYLVVGKQDPTLVGFDGMSTKEEKAHELNNTGKAQILIINEEEFVRLASTTDSEEVFFEMTEESAYCIIHPALLDVIAQNNVDPDKLTFNIGDNYASVFYHSALAFRICCRDRYHYFSISDSYADSLSSELASILTSGVNTSGFVKIAFDTTEQGLSKYIPLLCAILNLAIDSIPKEFDCCSRFEECSNAKKCIHPNPNLATVCGYRKLLKSGRIFYGENRNID